jgi:hypothetical protein
MGAQARAGDSDLPLSTKRKVVTWVFAVLLPAAGFASAALLGVLDLFVLPTLTFAGAVIVATILWLHAPSRGPRDQAVAAGAFLSAVVVAIPFSIVFTPLGVAGLLTAVDTDHRFLGWATLGFAPLLGLCAYSANALRALRRASGFRRLAILVAVAFLTVPTSVGLGFREMATDCEFEVLETDHPLDSLSLEKWRYLAPRHDWHRLRVEYGGDSGPLPPRTDRERRIAEAYRRLTGREVYD